MTEKQDIHPKRTEPGDAPKNGVSPTQMTADKTEDVRTAKFSAPKSKFGRMLDALNAFLVSLDEEEPEPASPPEKPPEESARDIPDGSRAPEKCAEKRTVFGKSCRTVLFRVAVLLFLFILTIPVTIWALNFSEKHRIGFCPSDEVADYLTAEHEALETAALKLTPPTGKHDMIPPESFNAKCIEIVKPMRIYGDEYGIYLVTGKDWFNGEHGIFIAKDEENMPPDLNWARIEGRIYTYAIYD